MDSSENNLDYTEEEKPLKEEKRRNRKRKTAIDLCLAILLCDMG